MAKAIYNLDGSVTYRGKTFRVGDMVTIHRDVQGWHAESEWAGEIVPVLGVDPSDNLLLVRCPDGDSWYISMESTFEYSEEDDPRQQAKTPERKPWDMPELKPWMRVVNHNDTYVIAEVDGVLTGLRIGGGESLEFLQSSATAVYDAPRDTDGDVVHHLCLSPEIRGDLLWSKTVADKQRKDHETKEARRQGLQAEIDKLKAELEGLDAQ